MGIDPVRLTVVPTPVEADRFSPSVPPLELADARAFRFLAVLDWKLRTGWDAAVRAFVAEFAEHEDVSLVLKVRSSLEYSAPMIAAMIERLIPPWGGTRGRCRTSTSR